MSSKIISITTKRGHTNVSVDGYLWALWKATKGEMAEKEIKERAKEGFIVNSNTAKVYILNCIVKKGVIEKYIKDLSKGYNDESNET